MKWKPDNPETTIISRFDEATKELRSTCKRFWGDWIWQERLAVVDMARALLEALPDKEVEEEPRHYRCESCGKDFGKKLFSHSRAEDDGHGNPIEVQCGPIKEIE